MTKKEQDRLAVLRKRVSKVPRDPGVYRWLDQNGNILYVGKAKDLRSRMQSYVNDGPKRSAWNEIMVRQIHDFDVTVVRSEIEAFILESNLIKELQPKYNIMLKDDKSYVYVCISTHERYPRIEVTRRMAEKGKSFGPFTTGAKATNETLAMLDSILHFTACKKSLDLLNEGKELTGAPCLDFQIGKCCGLCIGAVSEEEYRKRIDQVVSFFRGNFTDIKRQAVERMQQCAKEQKFEKAARARDTVKFIESLEERQAISDTSGEDADVFGIALRHGKGQAVLLRQRDGKLVGQVAFVLKGEADSPAEAMAQFLPQYYMETQDIPDVIILRDELPEKTAMEEWLRQARGKAVRIVTPERGRKSKLLDMAERNAAEKVEQQFAAWEAETKKVEDALSGLTALLGLASLPRRIEGYDISHLGGTATVGSMVVFVNGKPKRDHYRSFNMRTVKEQDIDDYKSLGETLRRRLKYLTDDLKTVTARFKEKGIVLGKAKKAEQKILEEISAAHPNDIGSDDIKYKDYVVARKGEEIVGFCRLYTYPGSVVTLRSVWVKEEERGQKLGHALIRTVLAGVKKGKVYVHISKSSLLEYYAELGFQQIETPPDVLALKLQNWQKAHPGADSGMILLYLASKQKPDASLTERPDLLLIDGGKGQLGVIVDVLKELNLQIPLASLAKREEEIFVPGNPVSLLVQEGSSARFLLQRIRDEAHRFANDRRERRLESALFRSKLDDVPGIGTETKSALLKKFGSADAAIATTDEDLLSVLTQSQLAALRKLFPRKNS